MLQKCWKHLSCAVINLRLCAGAFPTPPPPAEAPSAQMHLSPLIWQVRAVQKSQTDGPESPEWDTGVFQRLFSELHQRSNYTHINTVTHTSDCALQEGWTWTHMYIILFCPCSTAWKLSAFNEQPVNVMKAATTGQQRAVFTRDKEIMHLSGYNFLFSPNKTYDCSEVVIL